MNRSLSRRVFLRLASLASGAMLAACAPRIVKETVIVKEEVEKEVTKVVEVEKEKIVKETVVVTEEKVVEKVVEVAVTATPAPIPTIETPKAPEVKPAPDKLVELVVWDTWGRTVKFGREPIQEVIDSWNQTNPNIRVEYLPALAELTAKLLTSVASGDPPNVCIVGPTTQLAYRGALTKLNDFFDLGGHEFLEEDIYPGCWDSQTVAGDIYSIAWNTNNGCLYYNTDHFQEADLDPNKPPTTIEELDAYAEKLTKTNDKGELTQLGFVPWFNIAGIYGTWASAFGAQLWNEQERKVTFDDPKSIESLEWQVGYAEKLGWDRIAAFNDSLAGQDPFGAGRLSMVVTGPWMIATYRSDYPSINWRTAGLPAYPGGPGGGTWLGGRWVIMPKGLPDPQMTWEFVKFFGGRASQLLYGVLTTNFSVFKEDNDNDWFNSDPAMKPFIEHLPECWPIPKIPSVDHAFFTAFKPMVEEALRGQRTPDDAMREATRLAQEEVDRFLGTL